MAWIGVALVDVVTSGFEFWIDFEARAQRFRNARGRRRVSSEDKNSGVISISILVKTENQVRSPGECQ